MRLRLDIAWLGYAFPIILVALITYVGDHLIGLPFWAALGIAVLAMMANGLLLEWEDHRPGGFFNPTEDQIARKPKRD